MNFLEDCIAGKRTDVHITSYSSVKRYIAAINVTTQMYNGNKVTFDLWSDPVVTNFMLAVSRAMPIETKYTDHWDPDEVFIHIHRTYPANDKLSTAQLRSKVIILFRLFTMNRSDCLSKLYRAQVSFSTDKLRRLIMKYRFGDVKDNRTKSSGRSTWTAWSTIASPLDPRVMPTLSLPHAVQRYIGVTRGDEAIITGTDAPATYHGQRAMFSSLTRQTRKGVTRMVPLKANTIASLCLAVMTEAGIDTSKYKAHSTRHAGGNALLAKAGTDVPRAKVKKAWMAKGRWRREATLNKFYCMPAADASDIEMPPLPLGFTTVDIQLRFVGPAVAPQTRRTARIARAGCISQQNPL